MREMSIVAVAVVAPVDILFSGEVFDGRFEGGSVGA